MSTAINPENSRPRTTDPAPGTPGAANQERRDTGAATAPAAPDRREIVTRQKSQYGGMKVGACFFGWLAATGMVVVLAALLAAIGAALGLTRVVDVGQATSNANTVGLVGGIVLLVVVLVAYYCGGYVAGRMARFNGARQGLGVWLWAVVIAIVVTILGLIAGNGFNLASIGGIPKIPLNTATLTAGGVVTAVAVAVVSLVGAVLGGLAGMRFHRRVDRVAAD